MKKICLVLAVILLFCSACSNSALQNAGKELEDSIANASDANNKYVLMVKGGYQTDNPDLTYDKAFSAFFGTPRWKYLEGENGENVVEFTGDCTYQDVAVKARVQFLVDEENGTFEPTYLAFNEVPQNMLTLAALIGKAFEVEAESETVTSGTTTEQPAPDGSIPSSSVSSPTEILYKGQPILQWMGAELASLRDVFGSPDFEGIVGEGGAYGYSYGDVTFVKSDYGSDIANIFGDPTVLTLNGTSLATDKKGLVSLLGEPTNEGYATDYTGEEVIGLYVSYSFDSFRCYITLETPDIDGKAYSFTVRSSAANTESANSKRITYKDIPLSEFFEYPLSTKAYSYAGTDGLIYDFGTGTLEAHELSFFEIDGVSVDTLNSETLQERLGSSNSADWADHSTIYLVYDYQTYSISFYYSVMSGKIQSIVAWPNN